MPKKTESNKEFQQRTFPDRIKKQREKNRKIINTDRVGNRAATAKERSSAISSNAALIRVEEQLGLKTPKAKPKVKGKSTSKSRGGALGEILRRPTSKTQKGLDSVLDKSKG